MINGGHGHVERPKVFISEYLLSKSGLKIPLRETKTAGNLLNPRYRLKSDGFVTQRSTAAQSERVQLWMDKIFLNKMERETNPALYDGRQRKPPKLKATQELVEVLETLKDPDVQDRLRNNTDLRELLSGNSQSRWNKLNKGLQVREDPEKIEKTLKYIIADNLDMASTRRAYMQFQYKSFKKNLESFKMGPKKAKAFPLHQPRASLLARLPMENSLIREGSKSPKQPQLQGMNGPDFIDTPANNIFVTEILRDNDINVLNILEINEEEHNKPTAIDYKTKIAEALLAKEISKKSPPKIIPPQTQNMFFITMNVPPPTPGKKPSTTPPPPPETPQKPAATAISKKKARSLASLQSTSLGSRTHRTTSLVPNLNPKTPSHTKTVSQFNFSQLSPSTQRILNTDREFTVPTKEGGGTGLQVGSKSTRNLMMSKDTELSKEAHRNLIMQRWNASLMKKYLNDLNKLKLPNEANDNGKLQRVMARSFKTRKKVLLQLAEEKNENEIEKPRSPPVAIHQGHASLDSQNKSPNLTNSGGEEASEDWITEQPVRTVRKKLTGFAQKQLHMISPLRAKGLSVASSGVVDNPFAPVLKATKTVKRVIKLALDLDNQLMNPFQKPSAFPSELNSPVTSPGRARTQRTFTSPRVKGFLGSVTSRGTSQQQEKRPKLDGQALKDLNVRINDLMLSIEDKCTEFLSERRKKEEVSLKHKLESVQNEMNEEYQRVCGILENDLEIFTNEEFDRFKKQKQFKEMFIRQLMGDLPLAERKKLLLNYNQKLYFENKPRIKPETLFKFD